MRLFKKLLAWWHGDLDPLARVEADRARSERELLQAERAAREVNYPL